MKILIEFTLFGIIFQVYRKLNKKEQERQAWEQKNIHRLIVADPRLQG